MKVYIAKIIVDHMYPIFKVKVSRNFDELRAWAEKAIDDYASEYQGSVMERSDKYFMMQSGFAVVTISLEEQDI